MTQQTAQRLSERTVQADMPIISALKRMDEKSVKMLFVFDSGKFASILTIGDIQRGIIRNNDLNSPIRNILDTDKVFARTGEDISVIKSKMLSLRAECMPIIGENGEIDDVVFWEDIFQNAPKEDKEKVSIPVVIMAGGLGTRLKPLTNIIPKPMIPVGEKTILELIMDRFIEIGSDRFFLSCGYKHDILEYYLKHLDTGYNIEMFKEEKPLGTIGSLSLLKGKIDTPFFVSNCDILINQDYREVYKYHVENGNDITIVTAAMSHHIPYGVVETGENGVLERLKEKPDMTYMINTGVYILEPHLIDKIPHNTFFHITDLMERTMSDGGRIGCFPVSEKSWTDIGDWNEYLKIISRKSL